MTATPKGCYRLKEWSDGNTENPRTVTVTAAKTYTATFEENIYSGTCGATGYEENVQWSLNMCTGTLSITGTGAMKDYGSNSTPWDSYRTSIKSITIANGVTHIGSSSFHYCAATSVTIPSSVITIGDFAFFRCASLTSINIPSSVTTINFEAFRGCTSLTSVTIPNSVTGLGMDVFNECTSLTSATLSNSITTIPGGLFEGCSALTSVKIPNGVTSIEGYAFSECSSLPSVTIPNSVTMLGYRVLYKCTSLKDIYVSWTTPDAIPEFPFDMPTGSAIRLHIPCGTKSIYQAPSGWKSYTHVEEIGGGTCGTNVTWTLSCDSILTISGTGAMANYPALNMPWKDYRTSITSVIISEGVTTIGAHAFSGCSHLTSLTIPPSITSIGTYAFYQCYAMESLYISDLTAWCNIDFGTYDSSPFSCNGYYVGGGDLYVNDTKVTTLTIPDGITEIKHHAFYGFAGITSIDFNQVTSIGNEAFNGCHGLSEVTIPEGVTAIGNFGFAYCTHLQSISIPASASSLGTSMLSANNMLTDIHVHWTENIPAWPDNFTKKNPQSSITLHIPCAAIELYQDADGWKDYTIEGEGGPYTVTVQAEDPTMGDVSIIVN